MTLYEIMQARRRLAPYLTMTPLERAAGLPGALWLKLENVNLTHSFKIRGALNAVLSLTAAERAAGIIAASSGNHAGGVACAAALVGTPARILMPAHTPQRKVQRVRDDGAEAVLLPGGYDDCEAEARRQERADGRTFISPYNDARIIAGAGTIGLELLEQLPQLERVVVCASGGGLIAGVATALKSLKPEVEVIGVCSEHTPAMYNFFYDAHLPEVPQTLAEALSGGIETGSITLPVVRALVSQVITVTEAQIAAAMRWLLAEAGWLVEGGGATGVAAALHGRLPADDRPTVIMISGGNVDVATVQRVLAQG
jgi:threonine dehydratase